MSSIASPVAPAAGSRLVPSARGRREHVKQVIWFAVLAALSLSIVAPALLIVGFVALRGLPGLTVGFVTKMPENGMTEGGILPAIVGSVYLVVLTMAMGVPVGVLGAIYLSEYARKGWLVRAIRIAILNLAGVPSIVYGLFGMGVFVWVVVPAMMRVLHISEEGHSSSCLLAGAATMALLVLPLVITTAEEALRQVPQHFRSSSLALGATKWQTVRRVVLPNALPGMLTGLMLAVGRAAGETAPILLTGAAFYMSSMPGPADALFKPFQALPYHLYATSTQLPDAPDTVHPASGRP
jgi:phosphate transport system permease protein